MQECSPAVDSLHFESLVLRLQEATNIAGFWDTVQTILHEIVPNDACVMYLKYTDFRTARNPSAALASTESERAPGEWQDHRHELAMTPASAVSQLGINLRQPCGVEPNAGAPGGAGRFRRYLSAEGWYYVACSLVGEGGRLSSEIAIRRNSAQGDFTAHEIEALNRLQPHFEATLQRVSASNGPASDGRMSADNVESMLRGPLSESYGRLTRAERKLVELVGRGFSNKEIADELTKSVRTVKTQLTSVYKKFGVRSRSKLLALIL